MNDGPRTPGSYVEFGHRSRCYSRYPTGFVGPSGDTLPRCPDTPTGLGGGGSSNGVFQFPEPTSSSSSDVYAAPTRPTSINISNRSNASAAFPQLPVNNPFSSITRPVTTIFGIPITEAVASTYSSSQGSSTTTDSATVPKLTLVRRMKSWEASQSNASNYNSNPERGHTSLSSHHQYGDATGGIQGISSLQGSSGSSTITTTNADSNPLGLSGIVSASSTITTNSSNISDSVQRASNSTYSSTISSASNTYPAFSVAAPSASGGGGGQRNTSRTHDDRQLVLGTSFDYGGQRMMGGEGSDGGVGGNVSDEIIARRRKRLRYTYTNSLFDQPHSELPVFDEDAVAGMLGSGNNNQYNNNNSSAGAAESSGCIDNSEQHHRHPTAASSYRDVLTLVNNNNNNNNNSSSRPSASSGINDVQMLNQVVDINYVGANETVIIDDDDIHSNRTNNSTNTNSTNRTASSGRYINDGASTSGNGGVAPPAAAAASSSSRSRSKGGDGTTAVATSSSVCSRKTVNAVPPPPPTPSTMDDNSSSNGPVEINCPICFDSITEIKARGHYLVSTVCGHLFCGDCLEAAVKQTKQCPTCRKKLTKKQFHKVYL